MAVFENSANRVISNLFSIGAINGFAPLNADFFASATPKWGAKRFSP